MSTWMAGAVMMLAASVSGQQAGSRSSELIGSWRAESYTLKSGATHRVDGVIFFSRQDWSVVFFVLGEGGAAIRGASEAGTYIAEGRRLTLNHHYHLSAGGAVEGLPASPLRMQVNHATAPVEPCTYSIVDGLLRIDFPSGNSMVFRRGDSQ